MPLTYKVSGTEQAFKRLRVKMATTVIRRLEERAGPEYERVAVQLAMEAGIGRKERKPPTYDDGYPHRFPTTSGPHYIDSFYHRVTSNGGDFPIVFEGHNSTPQATWIENGRNPSGKREQFPDRNGKPVVMLTGAKRPMPAHRIQERAVRIAVIRSSR